MEDSRVKPYLFNKRWIPLAEASGDISLMMDFDPDEDGIYGQIICYIFDSDEIAYIGKTVTEIIDDTSMPLHERGFRIVQKERDDFSYIFRACQTDGSFRIIFKRMNLIKHPEHDRGVCWCIRSKYQRDFRGFIIFG